MPQGDDSTWAAIKREIAASPTDVQVLPIDPAVGEAVRARLRVTERSALGALAANTGGLIVDHGWLRLLGGGHGALPDLATASGVQDTPPPFLIVAYDVLGGRFAIDGGGLGIGPGEVCYWGPDTLRWTGIGGGHSSFVSWALGAGLAEFYTDLRWEAWTLETSALKLDQGISIFPPPFTTQGGEIGAASRRPISYAELIDFYADMARQLEAVEEGAPFQLIVTEAHDKSGQAGD